MAQNYNKSQMVNEIAEATLNSRVEVANVLECLVEKIKEKAAEGVVVNLHGLGRFEQKTRKARVGRNPATGEAIDIPETQYLAFKATKSKS